jgi:catechol 2,3-dioxygenase-like lactoylglutathione lyase family enzyme
MTAQKPLARLGRAPLWVLAALIVAAPLAAQYTYAPPWQGRGATSPQAVTVDSRGPIGASAVAAVGLTVSDMERSVRFYTDVLTFERVSDATLAGPAFDRLVGVPGARARVVQLRLGDEMLELTQFLDSKGRAAPADSRSNDRWFQHVALIVSDMDRAFARLERAGVRHASAAGPERLPDSNPNAGGIKAFYFRDPDGHPLEILQFPDGKGRPKWHRPSDRLFLGIDHTAIVVANTDASLAFYRDALGLSIAGRSENYGPEQEHLNNVPGAHLRITSLRAADGPGIEFLEYVHPRDGRPYPRNERADDLVHWQTRLLIPDAGRAAARLKADGIDFVSAGAIPLKPGPGQDGTLGVQVRDPDGHVIQLIEP